MDHYPVVSAIGGLVAGAMALRRGRDAALWSGASRCCRIPSPIIVLALKLPWQVLIVTALVTGFGNMLFNTLWETTLQQHIPVGVAVAGQCLRLVVGSLLCEPIGVALAGVVAAGIGMSQTLWIAAAVDLVSVAALLAAPSVRHLKRVDEPRLERSAV